MCKVENMYLVFDIGGTNTKIGFSDNGKSLAQSEVIQTPQDPEQFASKLKETAKLLDKTSIKACAIGIRGILNDKKDSLIHDLILPNWVGKSLKQTFQDILGAPVFLGNDAAFSALGETIQGAGVGFPIVGYLSIGTGVGGARVVYGKIDSYAVGFEPGHQIVSHQGMEFEQYISGKSLEKENGMPAEEIKDQEIWDEAAKKIALGLTNTILHWSPNIMVLGGGLMQKIPLEIIRTKVSEYLKVFPTPPEITPAKLGQESGLYGALEYIRQNS